MSNSDKTSTWRTLSRRGLLAGAAMAAVGAGAAGRIVQASEGEKEARAYTAGTYTAVADGKGGPLAVEVVLGDATIDSVAVTSHHETPRLADAALEGVPAAIVEHQSLAVDGASGATITSFAIKSAVADCIEQAGGDPAALEAVPVTVEPVHEEYEADVVVVGAGGAGVAAALAAAQAGAQKVVVVEQASEMGGNALVCGGYLDYINAPDSLRVPMTDGYRAYYLDRLAGAREDGLDESIIAAAEQDFEKYLAAGGTKACDSVNFHCLDYYYCLGGAYPLEHWATYSPSIVELDSWLTELGITWAPLVGIVGNPWPRSSHPEGETAGQGYFNLYERSIEGAGLPVQFIYGAAVTDLVVDDGGRVAGVVAQGSDGSTYRVSAAKGVVLATGGFSGNPAMLKENNEMWPWDDDTVIPTTNCSGHTGDGITLACSLGARTVDMGTYMLFPYADCVNYSTETIVGPTSGALWVNQEGVRFVREDADRATLCLALMEQTDERGYIISDAHNSGIVDETNYFGVNVQVMLDRGQLFKADTVEELAQLVGIDPETLVETVSKYNGYVEAGVDPDLGRTAFSEEHLVETGPFYASPRRWAAHITVGGLDVDSDWKVLDEQGQPIDGLFAVGELVNGYLGITSMANGLDCGRKIMA